MTLSTHQGQPLLSAGAENQDVISIVILLHGRGARAESMLSLANALQIKGARFLIPQAASNRWYPQTAFGPLETNEPDLSSALMVIRDLINKAHSDGFSDQQIYLGGFSQGACLAAEYAFRYPARYGGLFVYSGALIGPPGIPRELKGSYNNMPVFIGGSDIDPWVPYKLLETTAAAFDQMGADVNFSTYPGLGHTINADEINQVREMLQKNK